MIGIVLLEQNYLTGCVLLRLRLKSVKFPAP